MRLRSLVFQALLIASIAVRPVHAGELFSCYTLGGLNSCAGATFFLEQSPEFGSVLSVSINQWTTPLPLRLTAFGLYGKHAPDDLADNFSAPSAWTGLIPLNWTRKAKSHVALATLGGHRLFAGSSVPMPDGYDFAVGGPAFLGDVFQFDLDGKLPSKVLWVWRAQSQDGSIVIDCFQGSSGATQCLTSGPQVLAIPLRAWNLDPGFSQSAFGTASLDFDCENDCLTATPEPSTMVLLLSGFAGLTLAGSFRFRRRKG